MDAKTAIKVLKSNYPDSRYTELRKAVAFAIKVLEKEQEKEGK